LLGHDYAQPGAYFVTICTAQRACVFGEAVDGAVRLTDLGRLAETCWLAIPEHFPTVELDAFVVMPNHVHGIVVLTVHGGEGGPGRAGTTHASSLQDGPGTGAAPARGPRRGSLGVIVGSYKAAVSRRASNGLPTRRGKFWQERYWDHVIRDERALETIRAYITANPWMWLFDHDNRHGRPATREDWRHHGFTDEELDFIINYDIKYRMGRDGGCGEEG